jgi:molybdate transport system permease protein
MDWSPLWISLSIAIPATLITFFLGIYSAHRTLKTKSKIRKLLDTLFTLPLVLPPTVIGFLLLLLFGRNGSIGSHLWEIGIHIVFTRTAAILAAVVVAFPLMYRSAKASFEQLDPKLIYAARILGLSEATIFWRVCMPNALPGIVSGTILAFARALGEFGATLMIAGNIPGETQTMPLAIYMAIQEGSQREAIVWVLLLIALSFLMIYIMGHFSADRREERNQQNELEG